MNPRETTRTPIPKVDGIERGWSIINAEGQNLGRVATRCATLLMGKHKTNFTPHLDTGDNVIVVNCEKITVTGNKLEEKLYYRYSGFFGGLRSRSLKDLLANHPDRVIELAVARMLNRKSKKGRRLMNNLRVYAGPNHPHTAQKPVEVKVV